MKIIEQPIITEKTLAQYKDFNKVTFEINPASNKVEASKAVESIYGVKVLEAKVNNRLGKYKYSRFSKRISKLKDKKVMVFRLEAKSKLDLFESK